MTSSGILGPCATLNDALSILHAMRREPDPTKAADASAALPMTKHCQRTAPAAAWAGYLGRAARPRAPGTGLKPDAIGAPRRTRSTCQNRFDAAVRPARGHPSVAAHH